MTRRVALHHATRYRYDRAVGLSPHVVRLRPAPHTRTPIPSYSLHVRPEPHFINWQQDAYGNYLGRLVFPEKVRSFEIDVDLVAELTVQNPFDFFLEPAAERVPFAYDPALTDDLTLYRRREAPGERVRALVDANRPAGQATVDWLVSVNRAVHGAVEYVIRMEPGVQAPEQTLALGKGSCRDSAWLLVQVLRQLGVAARFVSGYLIQLVADERPLEGPAGPTADFTDLHAWTEVYLPGAGWVGLDPTSGLLAGEGHIPLACTPEPQGAAPVTGSVAECEVEFGHEMAVTRIAETPRVTRPFSDEAWAEIDALGEAVDRELHALDARLTHGGEPTFVGIDAPDAPEWNLEALGEHKRERAADLVRRLLARFAPGGLLHLGQGKWYPGEQLPRWAMSIFFRRDGRPLWHDPTLFAPDGAPAGDGPREAERLIHEIARRLGVNPRYSAPAYEDAFYYLWRERRLPVNVNPLDSKLRDEAERARLARAFEGGLGRVVGYALPLAPEEPGTGLFRSGLFTVRSGHLFLLPGDSPMGYRLPLDSLPWMPDADEEPTPPRDPFAAAPPLPSAPPLRGGRPTDGPLPGEGPAAAPAGLVRTALCVEPRGGTLHVFLPPCSLLEDFIALVSAIEAAARDLSRRVVIEGYPPPQDQRLERLAVTPDPGVLEVNLHPSSSWRELVTRTEALQEEARAARLSTEKFEIDGRHSGTGGGCHITLGGPTPADSPFLRRPDLLASLVGYFHDHPALSYVFAGLFVGPTSQAPRVDEARHEATYELEIALRRLEAATPASGPPPPWLVDRIFRHVLADQTGNTHRSAICIDKLYSPDGPTGRLGLVELRAFEMPPHPRMSLLTQLLVRALVAKLLREPYRAALPRWGTDLHDRFLLPHFLAADLRDVLGDLGRAGFRFDPSWFDVHHEFRFPRLGAVVVDGVELELRRALEPWHVLAEEPGPGGTSRAVDSSLERVQLRVRGAVPTRHAVLVNGVPAPLTPTGTQEEAVAGVRYRAWALPRSLHPTVRLHSPLVVDVVDQWTGRAIGGCTVHAAHPGGRSYDRRPVNANEAEARRSLLFSPMGHTPGARRRRTRSILRGAPRDEYGALVESLAELGADEMQRRWDQARRLIRDNGVTYNVYGDPRGMHRPWELDPVPLVLRAGEFARLAAGLAQRARLLEAVVHDLHGEQRLLTRRLLPPELVLGNPGFLRPLAGTLAATGRAIELLATDVARRDDGSFVALGDRVQSPSGAGYAVENRIVVSRVLPGAFRELRVLRLAGWFRTLRDSLRELAPGGREQPRIVVLTPGPHNETYFEHSYLARYLGFSLVEGADLTVRGLKVWVKTLGGLERVDVILRRLDDAFADPLALRADSTLGVAGLAEAVRAGNVAVANALGAGVVESPALLAFLPRLCRELLGEDLTLPSVPTTWCGDPAALPGVLERLPSLVIKPAYPGAVASEPVFAGRISQTERAALADRIRRSPERFVAQEQVSLSTAPVWNGDRLEPRHVAIRTFVAATRDGHAVMPGGLGRVSPSHESLVVSMQRGAGSKDLWVLAEHQEVSAVSLLRPETARVPLVRSGGDLPSRVADNMFWLGRYLERAEGTVRLLRPWLSRLIDDGAPSASGALSALIRAVAETVEVDPELLASSPRDPGRLHADVARLIFSLESPQSLRAVVQCAHRAASVVRDRLALDTWHVIARARRVVDERAGAAEFGLDDGLVLLSDLILLFSALAGASHESMIHGPGWRFLDLGRRVERLHHTARVLAAVLAPGTRPDGPTLEALLEAAESIITYRNRYVGALALAPVLDLLVTDESNPRSLAFQLLRLDEHVRSLPRATRNPLRPEEVRLVLAALSRVQLLDVHALSPAAAAGAPGSLSEVLGDLARTALALADALTRAYLTHAEPSQSLDGLS